jgi:hypothetical protein
MRAAARSRVFFIVASSGKNQWGEETPNQGEKDSLRSGHHHLSIAKFFSFLAV